MIHKNKTHSTSYTHALSYTKHTYSTHTQHTKHTPCGTVQACSWRSPPLCQWTCKGRTRMPTLYLCPPTCCCRCTPITLPCHPQCVGLLSTAFGGAAAGRGGVLWEGPEHHAGVAAGVPPVCVHHVRNMRERVARGVGMQVQHIQCNTHATTYASNVHNNIKKHNTSAIHKAPSHHHTRTHTQFTHPARRVFIAMRRDNAR